jgi:hypothetical protein
MNYLLGFLAAYPPFRDKIIEEYEKIKPPLIRLIALRKKRSSWGN